MYQRILFIQTAFAGDLILTLPLVQAVSRLFPQANLDLVCIPGTAPLLEKHPFLSAVLPYEKRGRNRSIIRFARSLREHGSYDLCISPHRSLRSALLALLSGAGTRVGFSTASGAFLYTHRIPYAGNAHEVQRNLDLLQALNLSCPELKGPWLFPSPADRSIIDHLLRGQEESAPLVLLAPGSVWATKRWIPEGFARVAEHFASRVRVCIIGGKDDVELAEQIVAVAPNAKNLAGALTFLQTAELVGRASLVISNDSAPVHLASAMGTPVVEIFGATVPEFGFTPWRVEHRIVQKEGMECRPCGIHGGQNCPLRTFDCMKELEAEKVIAAAEDLLNSR